MSDDTLNKIRLTGPPPVCSGCGGQYPDRLHVDFSAAWDGPMIPSDHIAGHQPVSVDDLVLCDECVRTAARLVGMTDNPEEELARLTADVDSLGERLAGAVRYVATLEQTLAQKDELVTLMGLEKKKAPASRAAK